MTMTSNLQRKQKASCTQDENLCIIFLDVDGVLLPFGGSSSSTSSSCSIPSCTLEALSFILEHVPSSRLVLSSTWRVQERYIQNILEAFHRYDKDTGSGALLGIDFYDITDPAMHSERQHEIHNWLRGDKFYRPTNGTYVETSSHVGQTKRIRKIDAWVALDDEELILGDANAKLSKFFRGHVVKTESSAGLTMDDAIKAVELLQSQLRVK